MSYLFQIFCRHSWDVSALVKNNLRFLVLKLFILEPKASLSVPQSCGVPANEPLPLLNNSNNLLGKLSCIVHLFRPRLVGQMPRITSWHLPFIYKIIITSQSTISWALNYFLKIILSCIISYFRILLYS